MRTHRHVCSRMPPGSGHVTGSTWWLPLLLTWLSVITAQAQDLNSVRLAYEIEQVKTQVK